MRKSFSILFSIILLLGVLAACGGNNSSQEKPAKESGDQKTGKDTGLKKVTIQIDGAAVPLLCTIICCKRKRIL